MGILFLRPFLRGVWRCLISNGQQDKSHAFLLFNLKDNAELLGALGGGEDAFMFSEKKRKYAYEKAIEAYWKHVDRYHTWMNYYALFNGALFVGFCTLLTATTRIEIECYKKYPAFDLKNDYEFLQIVLCCIGLVSAIAWLCSVLGHEKWEKNWMNIIEYYENKNLRIYNLLIVCKEFMDVRKDDNHKLESNEYFKAYSTHKITKAFIFSVICGWGLCLVYALSEFFCAETNDACCVILLVALLFIALIYMFKQNCEYKLYSNVEGKYWINKFR